MNEYIMNEIRYQIDKKTKNKQAKKEKNRQITNP